MSQSLVKNLVHVIYSTKQREPWISKECRDALSAYQAGRVEFVTLLEAQRALREARMGYFKAQANVLQSLADLERAVGRDLP